MENREKNEEIDEKALRLMKLRIIKLEKTNARDNKFDEKNIVKEIDKIIREELP